MAQATKLTSSALPGRKYGIAAPPSPYLFSTRAAMVHVSMPWRGLLPVPDGVIDQPDRAQAATYARRTPLAPLLPYLFSDRAAMVHVSMPWRGLMPVPDGVIDAQDRAQAATYERVQGPGAGGASRRGMDIRYIQPIQTYGRERGPIG